MKKVTRTGVIVLAAGSSSRLGQPKQLVHFQGKTLLQRALDLVASFDFATRVLVLGAHAGAILAETQPGTCTVVSNDQWAEGMASSIRAGLRKTLALEPETDHVLILLADQPFVTAELLATLLEAHTEANAPITASSYAGILGVPAIFSKAFFPELLALSGDRGAKQIMKQHASEVQAVPFERGLLDVDTPEDLARLREAENTGKD